MTSLFAIYTIIGTKTTSNPYGRYGWPSLYSFEGKTTKRRAPIVHSKMGFSRRNLEQKRPVFLPYTQCNDSKETAHTWQDGEGIPGDGQVLEGGILVTEEHPGGIPHRILRESEWY